MARSATQNKASAHLGQTPESFFVGGRYVDDGRGDQAMIGQMYVRRIGDDHIQPPIVLVHGAAQTGAHYEITPDGRPGLAVLLARHGRTVYVVDQPGIGRSRYLEAEDGPLAHYGSQSLSWAFTHTAEHGAWPRAHLHTQWPGAGVPGDSIFDDFFASQVGHKPDYRRVELTGRGALAALLDRIGPAFVLTHSQSGPLGWHAADARPQLLQGIVALEPHGPPFFGLPHPDPTSGWRETLKQAAEGPPAVDRAAPADRPYGITTQPLTYDPPLDPDADQIPFEREQGPVAAGRLRGYVQATPARRLANLTTIPVLLITSEASYHTMYDHLTARFLTDAGVDVAHVRLAERGVTGNGHLMALEANNGQLADLITEWLKAAGR